MDVEHATEHVQPILDDVRERGADALREFAVKFDGVLPPSLRVPAEVLQRCVDELDADVRAALEESIRRARVVHRDQRRTDVTTHVVEGGTVTEKWIPVGRVGLYVPGGVAVYPSSVVMNVVPAQEAGVESIAVTSPPQKDHDGLPHPTILAACALLGVDEVYAVGGAQAIAMFAYGADDSDEVLCEPVDVVTGPGNIFVATAKRLVKGVVGIDSEAGPTEVMVLADHSADPKFIAADLISQAEHDTLAGAVLVTDDVQLAELVDEAVVEQLAQTKHHERVREALSGQQSAIVLVDDLDGAVEVADAYAAEHLEVICHNAEDVAARVRNAGAIFVGPWAPVSLGDYVAGSNHVLPTGGTAVHSSGLSVQTFLRGVHVVTYSEDALRDVTPHVMALSAAEDLPAHGQAVSVRVGE